MCRGDGSSGEGRKSQDSDPRSSLSFPADHAHPEYGWRAPPIGQRKDTHWEYVAASGIMGSLPSPGSQ